jgi:hypothetical protein
MEKMIIIVHFFLYLDTCNENDFKTTHKKIIKKKKSHAKTIPHATATKHLPVEQPVSWLPTRADDSVPSHSAQSPSLLLCKLHATRPQQTKRTEVKSTVLTVQSNLS